MEVGDEIIIITWLHRARRNVLKVCPRGDASRPLTGVFSTRSPDRPNPLGLHRVKVLKIGQGKLRVGRIEAIDETPVVDINRSCQYQLTRELSCPRVFAAKGRFGPAIPRDNGRRPRVTTSLHRSHVVFTRFEPIRHNWRVGVSRMR
jgi:hypothetical protein